MTTIVTALRGDSSLTERWVNAYFRCRSLEDKLVLSAVTDADVRLAVELGATQTFPFAPFSGKDEEARVEYISEIMKAMLSLVETETVVLWDDDIVPPDNGLKLLEDSLAESGPDVAGIVSLHPYASDQRTASIFFKPFGAASNMDSVPTEGLHQVWGGGTAFSIWRTDVLKATLPWGPYLSHGTTYGWDYDLASKLEAKRLKTLLNAGIVCRHDRNP